MTNVIITGGPGSGKGTQSKRVAEAFGLIHISTGDLLREMNHPTLGTGKLVSDEFVILMVKEKIHRMTGPDKVVNGFVFDGFPRTVEQAIALDEMLKIDVAITLSVTKALLSERILERGKKSGRADDNIASFNVRMDEYYNKTYHIKDHYKQTDRWHDVDGTKTQDEVFKEVFDKVNNIMF
jgi:adenylate kinase